MGLCLMNRVRLCQVYVSHVEPVIKNSRFCTIYKSSVSPGFAKQIIPILRISCYNGSLATWTVGSLTITKFKPVIFSGIALSYVANMVILVILYDFCSYTYCRLESGANRCVSCKIQNGAGWTAQKTWLPTELLSLSAYPLLPTRVYRAVT
jgi:hypothetical protein